MPRKRMTPGALYALLNNELHAMRPAPCSCRMPLPFLVERPDEVSANWQIGTTSPCVNGCDVLISEIVARQLPFFDLYDPTSEPAKTEPTQKA